MTSEINNIDKRIIIVFRSDNALFDSIAQSAIFSHFTKGKAHSNTQSFANDSSL